jgi:cell division protein ZapA
MARVEIVLNGRNYAVACEDGAEQRLHDIVAFVDAKMTALSMNNRIEGSESQSLVLTCLMLADQIFDLRSELAKARTAPNANITLPDNKAIEERYAKAIETLAARVDVMASKLAEA